MLIDDIELDSNIKPHDPQERINLLIVDDEANVINSLKRIFRSKPYYLKTATSGPEAIEFLQTNTPDVIISDMRMPQMTGDEFLAEIYKIDPDIPCIVLSAYANAENILNLINNANVYSYVNKPWDEEDLKLKVINAAQQLFLKRSVDLKNRQLFEINRRLEEIIKNRTMSLIETNESLQKTIQELDESYKNSVNMLAYFADHRMPELHGHSGVVAQYAKSFCQFLGLPDKEIKDIESAALLHDIGMLSLPEKIIHAPCAELSKEDELKRQEHAEIGEAILAGMPVLQGAASYVRSHHEHYDGSGYPEGLKGKQIPLGAQIILLANNYDTLISDYCDTPVYSHEEAVNIMQKDSGSLYEPELLDNFIKMLSKPTEEIKKHQGELVRALHSNELEPGMVLYQALKTKSGMILLVQDHTLTEKAIQSIKVMEKTEKVHYTIYIYSKSIAEKEQI